MLASPLPGFTPTSAFPSPILPFASLGPFNRMSHGLAVRGGELLFGRQIRDWRTASLGLGRRRPAGGAPLATLYAYSPEVVPVPPDWGPDVLVSGYWFLDSPDWRPDAELAAFLAAGEPPVHIGFGSMSGTDGSRSAETAVGALAKAGKRGLLALGDGRRSPGSLPDNIHAVEHAPHDRLFPLVSATVHHGGAGTTGASLRAGKPMVICPFFGDQPFWGRRVSGLGAGRVLARGALSEESLAAAIAALDDEETRARAAALGDAIRRERGAASAADFIERAMTEGRGRRTAIGP
jgi:UDP:flavonoid glycosyltransferase YjiC (YdhE family)